MTQTATRPPTVVLTTWETPIYQAGLADPDAADGGVLAREMIGTLRDLILEAEGHDSGAHTFGVIGAQKSSMDILKWSHPAVAWLRSQIRDAVSAMTHDVLAERAPEVENKYPVIAEAWAVVYRSGGSHRLHTHHDSIYSGTIYIECGGVSATSGNLQLFDPRPAAIARGVTPGVLSLQPRPGLLVAFPSWLPHSVQATQHTDSGLRICIAFNASYSQTGGQA
ncbi:TIGR02466 family protein [Nonomuraea ceibae]|uniref:TIGR02466 family protein n=1 Tax=Nonomuraea ceibae TaxID=1935170 RepID=UPI001C5D9D6D|nr:TIGR02466 family protein [Nonomuraea ceibae]